MDIVSFYAKLVLKTISRNISKPLKTMIHALKASQNQYHRISPNIKNIQKRLDFQAQGLHFARAPRCPFSKPSRRSRQVKGSRSFASSSQPRLETPSPGRDPTCRCPRSACRLRAKVASTPGGSSFRDTSFLAFTRSVGKAMCLAGSMRASSWPEKRPDRKSV